VNPVISIDDLKGWLRSPWGWLIIWVPSLVVVVALALIGTAADVHIWQPDAQRVCFYRQEQTELVTTGFFVQLANFWSNFGYLAVGLLILLRSGTTIGIGTGAAFILLALGSGYYHGSLAVTAQTFDIAGIDMVLLALILHGIVESCDLETSSARIRNAIWLVLLVGLFIGFTKGDVVWHSSTIFSILSGVVLAVIMVFGYINHTRKYNYSAGSSWHSQVLAPGLFALVTFALAAVFKYGDMTDVTEVWAKCTVLGRLTGGSAPASIDRCVFDLCQIGKGGYLVWSDGSWAFSRTSLIQGHALWHIFSAVALMLVFEYFTSFRNKTGSIRPWR
jgi:hypothetical protein